MRRIVMMFLAAGLALGAAPYARSDSSADLRNPDKMQAARVAEIKGDSARLHDDCAGAVPFYRTALRDDPQNAVLYNKLGVTELQLHERSAARKHFVQAIKYDPRFVPALNNLGAVAFLDKKYKPAIDYFKRALELDETSAPAHLNIADAWMRLNDIDRVMTEYARALELDADILSTDRAGTVAQVTTPEQRARVSFLIARAYAKRGNLDGALEYLKRAKDGHFPEMAKVYTDHDFAALWVDPRLAKIVKP